MTGQRRGPLRRRTDLKISRHGSTHGPSKVGAPPRLPDAAYEEIADALVAEAARMPSLGSSPGNGRGFEGAKADARRSNVEGPPLGTVDCSDEVYVERKGRIERVE